MDFFDAPDFSDFFTPDDILEVVTDLTSTPFTGRFVAYNYNYICLCDDDGRKSVVPNSNVKYITSHKSDAPAIHIPVAKYDERDSTESAADSQEIETETASTPIVIKPSTKWKDEFQDGVEGPLREVSVKVLGRVDLDNQSNSGPKKRYSGDERYSETKRPRKYNDPLDELYPEAMGTVKRTGTQFYIITTNDGQDLKCMKFHAIGNLYVGDKVLFSTFTYYSKYDNEGTLQACSVIKACSVGKMISIMEDMRYERNGKDFIADLTTMLKELYPDNEDVTAAIQDNGFDRYYTRDRKRIRKPETASIGENTDASGYYIPLAERKALSTEAETEAAVEAEAEETVATIEETEVAEVSEEIADNDFSISEDIEKTNE